MKKLKKYLGVILCLIVFAMFAMGSGSDGKTSVDNSNAKEAADQSKDGKDNIVQVGGSFEKKGLKFTVTDGDINYIDYDNPYGWYSPSDGMKYVKADFTFENMGNNDIYVSQYDFNCYADNTNCDQKFMTSGNEFLGGNISAGRQVSFSVVFEVPEAAESIELEYKANIWSSEKVIIKLK